MTAAERLAEVFDRGLRNGVGALPLAERDLYLIQDFIIEYEMNGLSGYFYNRLPDLDLVRDTIAAMRQHRLAKLADLLAEAAHLFRRYADPNPPTTWGELLRQYDPGDSLKTVSDRIEALDNYGLAGATIVDPDVAAD